VTIVENVLISMLKPILTSLIMILNMMVLLIHMIMMMLGTNMSLKLVTLMMMETYLTVNILIVYNKLKTTSELLTILKCQ
jgi:hypothetical protein